MTLCIPNVWQCYYIVVYTDDFAHCEMFWIIIQAQNPSKPCAIPSMRFICFSFIFHQTLDFVCFWLFCIWIVAIIDLSSKKILWFIVLTWWMSGKRRQSTREVIRFPFLLLYAIVFTSMVFRIFIEIESCCVFASGIAEHFNMEQVSDFRVYLLK